MTESVFNAMLRLYERTLQATLRHGLAVVVFSFLIIGATVWLFLRIPKGFLPSEDTNQVFAITEAPQGASHTDMARDLETMADLLRKDSAIHAFFVGMEVRPVQLRRVARISDACSSI